VPIVIAMLLGGMIAAPLAAYVVRYIPPRALGIAVSALLLFTNVRELAGWRDVGAGRWFFYALVTAACGLAALRPRIAARVFAARTVLVD
jgi:uncharacterized protein